jgi:hypothetical protein
MNRMRDALDQVLCYERQYDATDGCDDHADSAQYAGVRPRLPVNARVRRCIKVQSHLYHAFLMLAMAM